MMRRLKGLSRRDDDLNSLDLLASGSFLFGARGLLLNFGRRPGRRLLRGGGCFLGRRLLGGLFSGGFLGGRLVEYRLPPRDELLSAACVQNRHRQILSSTQNKQNTGNVVQMGDGRKCTTEARSFRVGSDWSHGFSRIFTDENTRIVR